MKYVFLNYKFCKAQNAAISINDRGFRFGDGVFETIKISNYQARDLKLHINRLAAGLDSLKIKFDLSIITLKAQELIKKNHQENGILRIIITRGSGSRGYLPNANIKPNLLIETVDIPEMELDNLKLIISNYQKPSLKALPVHYKLLQGLNSTLVKLAAKELGFTDGILTDDKNHIVETSSANIFLLKKGKIYTPSQDLPILNGVVRSKIINEFSVSEKQIKIKELKKFDLIFITNIAIEAVKVLNISDKKNSKLIWQSKENAKSLVQYLAIKQFLATA